MNPVQARVLESDCHTYISSGLGEGKRIKRKETRQLACFCCNVSMLAFGYMLHHSQMVGRTMPVYLRLVLIIIALA